MPLIHSKRPAAFKKNIETEMEHGKPQKQAVAIAYKMAGEKKAKGGEMCAHGGRMHCNMGCYDSGGSVTKTPAQSIQNSFNSALGSQGMQTAMQNIGLGGKKKMAHGGYVDDDELMGRKPSNYKESKLPVDPGFSQDPELMGRKGSEYMEHKRPQGDNLEDDPQMLAEGGEAGEGDEMEEMLGEELMDAFHRKDKKALMECLEACIMHCMSKGDNDV